MNCCPHRRCRKLARRKEATAGQPLSMQAAQLLSPAYFYATSCHILSSSKFTWWLTKKLIALRSRFGSRKLRCASYPAGSTRQPCSPLHMSDRERDTAPQRNNRKRMRSAVQPASQPDRPANAVFPRHVHLCGASVVELQTVQPRRTTRRPLCSSQFGVIPFSTTRE